MTRNQWNKAIPSVQFRIARSTNKFKEVIQFYEGGIGLPEIDGFGNHNGYDGVMFGLRGFDYHLEFISYVWIEVHVLHQQRIIY